MLGLRWTAAALFVLLVPVFLVLTNVRIAATEERVYSYAYSQYHVPERTGIERSELDRATRQIVHYFRSSEDEALLDIRVDAGGREQALFTQREVLHMRDVRDLFRLVFRVHEVAFVYIVGYVAAVFLWSRERSMRRLAQQAVVAGGLTAALLAATAVAVLVGFDGLFTQFHLLSFSNDLWQLDPDRHRLIQMFPQGFWFDVTLGVGMATVVQGGLLAMAGLGYLVWLDRSRPRWRPRSAPARPADGR